MLEDNTAYYVYVIIDPRNFEEFYYGKGIGNRKNTHLTDNNDSEKYRRIEAIYKEGQEPIIKVIAKDLTEKEAFLVEKTLIWKLGKNLTNQSSGLFADKFRPHDTFHKDLLGFDFKNGLYYVNVGEGIHRCWADCKYYGFLSAGQGKKYSNPLKTLKIGDIVAAYLSGHGYVGIGRVIEEAVRVNDFKINGQTLNRFDIKEPNIFENSDNEKSEFIVKVDWIKTVDSEMAKWKSNIGLYSKQQVKASLQGQPKTREFLENEFEVNFYQLLEDIIKY